MRRFKNILAVYNDSVGSDDALSHAAALARKNNTYLTVMDVGPERFVTASELAERRKRLNRLVESIKRDGLGSADAIAITGTPFLEIIRQVLRAGHDLVIAAAGGNPSFKNYFFGSTPTHLMRKCPCPVWIIKPGQTQNYQRIMACVDPKSDDVSGDELNTKILDISTSLALQNNARLEIVHAWEVEGKDRDTISSEVSDRMHAQILVKHEAGHRARVEKLLEKYPLDELKHRLHTPRASEPQWAILDLVDKLEVDLVVMGTVCRTGISGFFIGNAAETVLSLVHCGVFTVKPKGFVSPVALDTKSANAA